MTEIDEILKSENRALVWPVLAILSLFLPWVRISGLLNIQLTGLDMDIGPIILITALVVAGTWLYDEGNYRKIGWLGGGAILGLLTLIGIWNIQDSISQYQSEMEGNMFADAVGLNIGSGVYLAAIASVGVIYVGYQIHSADAENVPEESPQA